jgi:hypothetical protein
MLERIKRKVGEARDTWTQCFHMPLPDETRQRQRIIVNVIDPVRYEEVHIGLIVFVAMQFDF